MTPEEVKEAKARQASCQQCMQLALSEVARLIEVAKPDLTKGEAAAIVRDWAESRRAINAAIIEAIK
jgi:hypothetical protein